VNSVPGGGSLAPQDSPSRKETRCDSPKLLRLVSAQCNDLSIHVSNIKRSTHLIPTVAAFFFVAPLVIRDRACRDEVVIISIEELRRLKGAPTGAALIAAMQASPAKNDQHVEPKATIRRRPPQEHRAEGCRMHPCYEAETSHVGDTLERLRLTQRYG
jgi:hypothetical protein